MADIELVIKIPEGLKKDFESEQWTALSCMEMKNALENGIPLPKGHGNLKDVGKCDRKLFYQQCGGADSLITVKTAFDMLLSLPTIIEADKEPTKQNSIEQLIDDIEGLTWYRNVHGYLVEGATSKTGLYKASDIAKILEKYKRGVEK